MKLERYRDFAARMGAEGEDRPETRLVEDAHRGRSRDWFLVFVKGKNGGVALVDCLRGRLPETGNSFKIPADTTRLALSQYLLSDTAMKAAREMLTPDSEADLDIFTFAVGLHSLERNEYGSGNGDYDTKPPSLDGRLWLRIPRDRRMEFVKAMAMGLRRGIHPDQTTEEMLA
jgi:hypothetical protein